MQISIDNAGKKFGNQWIFRNLSYDFEDKSKTSVLGKNGSGKSTLLKVISGYLSLSAGNISYSLNNEKLPEKNIYKHISVVSPHLQLIEEYTLQELIDFHFSLKPVLDGLKKEKIPELLLLNDNKNKQIKKFSSGMKQRVKLGLAFFSKTDLLLFDEPCNNLDKDAIKWYQQTLINTSKDKTVVIFSNHNDYETVLCTKSINL